MKFQEDILVNSPLKFTEISAVISEIFSIKPSEILVIEEVPEQAISNDIRLLCQVQYVDGDFKQIISMYFKEDSLLTVSLLEFAGKICDRKHYPNHC